MYYFGCIDPDVFPYNSDVYVSINNTSQERIKSDFDLDETFIKDLYQLKTCSGSLCNDIFIDDNITCLGTEGAVKCRGMDNCGVSMLAI